jgi:hypothetical protein
MPSKTDPVMMQNPDADGVPNIEVSSDSMVIIILHKVFFVTSTILWR